MPRHAGARESTRPPDAASLEARVRWAIASGCGRAERTIVAVFADERFHGLAEAATPAIYLPTGQAPVPNGSILVRVDGRSAEFAGMLRGVIRRSRSEVPVSGVEPLDQTLSHSTAQRRFTMLVLGVSRRSRWCSRWSGCTAC